MKKIIALLVILCSGIAIGQSSLQKTDFVLNNGRYQAIQKTCMLKNGDNKLSEAIVTVGFGKDMLDKIGIQKINEMIDISNDKSRNIVRNKYTYVSKVIKFSSMTDPDRFSVTIEFIAQNNYGATIDGLNSADFDKDGNFIEIRNIL